MRTAFRASMLSRFNKAMWDRWLAQLNGPHPDDPQVKYLAKGIAEFRNVLAEHDTQDEKKRYP